MRIFSNRRDAGKQLAGLLEKYKEQKVVVYALPRGGITVAKEIADVLNAPLSLILAHKIGHPYQPEYAVAAVSESGHIVGNESELNSLGQKWLEREKERQMEEIKRKRALYLKNRKDPSLEDKVAIIVDDGIATGLTMQAGILELKGKHPKKIIVAVPVSPKTTADRLKNMVGEFVGINVPEDYNFMGAVGAYYEDFSQVEDEEVIDVLEANAKQLKKDGLND
jgi:putative phosphoribosyl transferase